VCVDVRVVSPNRDPVAARLGAAVPSGSRALDIRYTNVLGGNYFASRYFVHVIIGLSARGTPYGHEASVTSYHNAICGSEN
jgi:hypothetical protein